ncbi:helix-turn-helix domain-containing protein [Streptomyces sp. NPDC101062]|uniref:helix-turn-helix domain-containing protein n=1 Tax=unclassified Streptomyces TaxID=2593676 RepID=UPI00382E9A3D
MQQVEYPQKGSRVTGAARNKLGADLKKKYDRGASIRELAEETGRSYGFTHRILNEYGAVLRGRGGDTRSPKAGKRRTKEGGQRECVALE